MGRILKIDKLSKQYGKLVAVNELSLEVNEGSVYGILGPNGSGKTTLLGMVLEVISPSSGSYDWFNSEPATESRKKIGSILETPAFYPYLSAERNLEIAAKIKGKGRGKINQVLEQVGLEKRRKDPYKIYSLGMKQRLAIASALLADPPVLILDEPTNGLDPQGIVEIRELIGNVASQGKTILIASHLLDEVQKVCTHFSVLNFGKKIYDGSVEEAMNQDPKIELASKDMKALKTSLSKCNLVLDLQANSQHLIIKLKEGKGTGELNSYLINRGIVLTHLVEKKSTLEAEFLKILKESND